MSEIPDPLIGRDLARKLFGDPPEPVRDPFLHYVPSPLAPGLLLRIDEAALDEMVDRAIREEPW